MTHASRSRLAALVTAALTLAGAALGASAQADASQKPSAPMTLTAATSRTSTLAAGPIVKLGPALLEEYAQTPLGPVIRELTPGGVQAVQGSISQSDAAIAGHKA